MTQIKRWSRVVAVLGALGFACAGSAVIASPALASSESIDCGTLGAYTACQSANQRSWTQINVGYSGSNQILVSAYDAYTGAFGWAGNGTYVGATYSGEGHGYGYILNDNDASYYVFGTGYY